MKHETNDLLRSALKKVNSTIRSIGRGVQFDLKRMRSDWSPAQNFAALKRLMERGHFQFVNDVNTKTHPDGIISKLGDTAVAQHLLVQKGASAPATNVAVFTSGNPFGVTLYGGLSTTEYNPVRLLCGGVGTVTMTSDVSAAIAVGDPLVGVSGGTVKTVTATGAGVIIVGIAMEACSGSATGTDKEFEAAPTWSKTY
jgi:hypothetical protein